MSDAWYDCPNDDANDAEERNDDGEMITLTILRIPSSCSATRFGKCPLGYFNTIKIIVSLTSIILYLINLLFIIYCKWFMLYVPDRINWLHPGND